MRRFPEKTPAGSQNGGREGEWGAVSGGRANAIDRVPLWGWQEVFRARAEKTDVNRGQSPV